MGPEGLLQRPVLLSPSRGFYILPLMSSRTINKLFIGPWGWTSITLKAKESWVATLCLLQVICLIGTVRHEASTLVH